MAKMIVTMEIDIEQYTDAEIAEWKKAMGLEGEDISDMNPDLSSDLTAEHIAGFVASVLPICSDGDKHGGPHGEIWAGSEMLAKLTNARVRSAAWEG